ncbi:MAG: hypothetical protein QOE70_747 [Chthoniobacter sp.]|jgi:hypothetical protein|nr:hypothetical protein [Chthoniobacter sp.]
MTLRLSLAVCLCLLTTALRADEAADRVEIVRRAQEMSTAAFKGDIMAVVKFTHPSVLKISGGEELIKKSIEGVAAQMKRLEIEFVSMDAQPPEKLSSAGGKTFAIVKTKVVMQIPGKTRITENGSMLAVRETRDGAWTFVRVNPQLAGNRALLKALLPDVPDEIVLEAPGKPVTEPLGP